MFPLFFKTLSGSIELGRRLGIPAEQVQKLDAAFNPRFLIDIIDVGFDGLFGDEKGRGDLGVAPPLENAPLVRVSGSTATTQVYSLYTPEGKAFVAVFSSLSTHFPNTPNPYFPGPPVKEIALMLAGKK